MLVSLYAFPSLFQIENLKTLRCPFQQQLLNERVEMRIHVPNREPTVRSNAPHNGVSNLSKDMGFSSINSPSINNAQWQNMPSSYCCFGELKMFSKFYLEVFGVS